ncbi:hypothetical protein [Confluentibacter sediminis]|uniref:hypothetical protein n=1 Tax=Confluentibacter sediminis TaxID=2219045 RepID=UPI000DAE87C6|nr:hypothetical protein [Confluentibacter sediminis]
MKQTMNLKMVLIYGCMFALIYVVASSFKTEGTKMSNTSKFYKPSGVITQERAIELRKTWHSKNEALFNKAGHAKFDDEIISLGWSLEDLRNYLDYAEHEAKEKGYNMTGVRVYFAAYPEKGGQNTLFFAPTGYKSASQASVFGSLFTADDEAVIPVSPLNKGTGGQGGDDPPPPPPND